jgi:ABC-type uncharacterized transport system substrate-binding protein
MLTYLSEIVNLPKAVQAAFRPCFAQFRRDKRRMIISKQYSRDLSVARAIIWRDHWHMSQFCFRIFALLLTAFGVCGTVPVLAHPHVMVVARAEVVYAPDGTVTAIRHIWAFDEAYSVYAVQGLDTNNDGIWSRAELAELAKVNVESLSEFGFFTVAKANGKAQEFGAPTNYLLAFDKKILTLTFTLPLKAPTLASKTFGLEISDPSWFVSFELAQGDDAVVLKDAPKGCVARLTRPKPQDATQQGKLGEDFFASGAGANAGLQFANRALVACP